MKGKNRPLPLSLMEIQKQGSARKCEGPLRSDKRWKTQTVELLDGSVGMELGAVLGVPVFSPLRTSQA